MAAGASDAPGRGVGAPGSEPVRQPIFHYGLDQSTAYVTWLGSLETALGDARARYRH